MTILFNKKYSFFVLMHVLATVLLFNSSCKKEKKEIEPTPEYSSVTDVEGNTYKTVKIGNQWWMAENLKVKKYRNGNAINEISSDTAMWRKDTLGAYSKIDNSNPAIDYGLLYNWHAVSHSNNIAPEGWHVPTDEEWKVLETHLGISYTEANKTGWRGNNEAEALKIEKYTDWVEYKDTWQTNESGFTALAGGCRMYSGDWGYPGIRHTGYWWSSSSIDNQGWYRHLDYKNKNVFRYYANKNYGFSIRCVKN